MNNNTQNKPAAIEITQIKLLREKLDLTQGDLAGWLQISQAEVSRREKGGDSLTEAECLKLGPILNVVFAEQPLEPTIKKLKKVQQLVLDVQDVAGTLIGVGMR